MLRAKMHEKERRERELPLFRSRQPVFFLPHFCLSVFLFASAPVSPDLERERQWHGAQLTPVPAATNVDVMPVPCLSSRE